MCNLPKVGDDVTKTTMNGRVSVSLYINITGYPFIVISTLIVANKNAKYVTMQRNK